MPLYQSRGWGAGPKKRKFAMPLTEFRDKILAEFTKLRSTKTGPKAVFEDELAELLEKLLSEAEVIE